MKKGKYVLLSAISVFICGLWLWQWNNTMAKAVIVPDEIHSLYEEVECGETYFWDCSENSNGYAISVDNSSRRNLKEFLAEYKDAEKAFHPQEMGYERKDSAWMYDVTVTVKNYSNVNGGIRFFDYILFSDSLILRIDPELLAVCEPALAGLSGFSMPVGKEKTLHLPFTADVGVEAANEGRLYNAMKNKEFYLCISQFPVRKLIQIS